MTDIFYLKLRTDIQLAGDIAIAERELNTFFQKAILANSKDDVLKYINIPEKCAVSNTRSCPPIGFIAEGSKNSLKKLVLKLNFIQEIWFVIQDRNLQELENESWCCIREIPDGYAICLVPMLAAAEFLSFMKEQSPSEESLKNITEYLCFEKNKSYRELQSVINRKSTSTPHVHGLHKYKAKFFPRLIRSFLVSKQGGIPELISGQRVLLDPFVGSGTALVEASLLENEAIGIDIDPLSCSISQAKINLLDVSLENLQKSVYKVATEVEFKLDTSRQIGCYHFPPWIAKKFERWNSLDEQKRYEKEIALWISVIKGIQEENLKQILSVCLSDAISRKFNIRMLGTGSGRFALEIGKTSLSSIVKSNLKGLTHQAYVVNTLKKAYGIKLPKSKIIKDTATAMPLTNESVSIILTSPPYLPASSGRENYLIGKSISITALGLMTANEIKEAEKISMGSMYNEGTFEKSNLPQDVQNLYSWLRADPLREVKAVPIIAYYKDLSKALEESYRVLINHGVAIYVIGKESVFYKFDTREVLHRVRCDDIFQEIAERVGFKVEERVDVELDKKNSNARPRSLDSYYETVFILRKSN